MHVLSDSLRVYVLRHPVRMSKSFDGLAEVVRQEFAKDPLSGDLFVFLNRRQNALKVLFWHRGGYWIYYRRLERGRFQLPVRASGSSYELDYAELLLFLEGMKLTANDQKRVIFRPFQ